MGAWLVVEALFLGGLTAAAQETLPWQRSAPEGRLSAPTSDYQARSSYGDRRYRSGESYRQAQSGRAAPDPYRSQAPIGRYEYGQPPTPPRVYSDHASSPGYRQHRPPEYGRPEPRYVRPYREPSQPPGYPARRYGSNEPYDPSYGDRRYDRAPRIPDAGQATYSENEVIDAGHRFFGTLSTGLAKAVQWAFKKSGRPNGYILGEDAGGAFIAGLRYGEGKLYTKYHGVRRVFWQGPSLGYDFGGDGNRTMTLVYNLRSPSGIYRRFGGVQGSAYLVGGVSVQFLRGGRNVTLAPIRTGVGVRLGANIGYLKFTRRPTWNPF